MYTVDRHDRVVELTGVPRPSVGTPLPVVLAGEGRLLLAYLLDVPVPGWDGTWTRVVDLDTDLSHLVFTFHDSTLEALARGFSAEPRSGPMAAVVSEMQQLLLSH